VLCLRRVTRRRGAWPGEWVIADAVGPPEKRNWAGGLLHLSAVRGVPDHCADGLMK
jgi:hypothetical protein